MHSPKQPWQSPRLPYYVYALYKFVAIDNPSALRKTLFTELKERGICGTLLVAAEGINGTIAGSKQSMQAFLDWLQSDPRFADIEVKISRNESAPFQRTKVKLKDEIVTMGVGGIDPNQIVGTYVEPQEWDQLISDEDTLLVDTRNDYEFEIGSFKGAINPNTESFREFPQFVENRLDGKKQKRVAMFCTGGIRCEKATAYLKQNGFDEVYHLRGGILNYLKKVPAEESSWQGECFVFDDRVAVNHALEKGVHDQCHACRYPITEEDKSDKRYVKGVSCPRCYERLSEEQKQRFAEREKQVQLAQQRGQAHIGDQARIDAERNRQKKRLDLDQV